MSEFSMCASHCVNRDREDTIFGISRQANDAISKYGKQAVVNATIGAIMDEEENLCTLPTIDNLFKELSSKSIAAYAPIEGLPEYLKRAIDLTFFDNRPEAYIESVATTGGSGAISMAISNYSEKNDYILTSDWYWDPYNTMAEEHDRKLGTFKLFNDNGQFCIEDFQNKINSLLTIQQSLLIILNSPAHNPTGFSISYDEWTKIIDVIKSINSNKKISLLVDIAYIDYSGEKNEVRKFMKLFGNLPKNILVLIAFSISKSYLMYGLRTGAIVGISSNKDVINEFKEVIRLSCRGTWSNCNRSGMELVINMAKNNVFNNIEKERLDLKQLLDNRANIFLKEAKEINLPLCPYSSGFFISIPHVNPKQVVEKLKLENIFAVPLEKGVRLAICAIPTNKLNGIAAKVLNNL